MVFDGVGSGGGSRPKESDVVSYGPSSYDVVPYTAEISRYTHANTLATVATLFGMNPPKVARARVLEIGCASGANLIPMAAELPEGSFLGIDLSERQVADGLATIEAAGLKNVELRRLDILDAGSDLGRFDYIICHGVFSWVPPEVRQKLLALIAETLAPDGVAFVSYNIYPGWHQREIVREAMLFHIDGEPDPQTGLRRARELLDFLVQFPSLPNNYYMAMIRDVRDGIGRYDESYLFHEFLEEVNGPLYYHQFLERAATAELKAVADARFSMNAVVAAEPVKAALGQISDDPARREVYLDFLQGRTFRRTLLCHEGVNLLTEPSEEAVYGLQAALRLIPGSLKPGISADEIEGVRDASNQEIWIDHPVLKGAVLVLGERFPQAMPFDDLWRAALDRVSRAGLPKLDYGEPERRRLARFLLRSYGINWLELHSHMPPFVREVSGRPATTPLARHQARTGGQATNLRHESVRPPSVRSVPAGVARRPPNPRRACRCPRLARGRRQAHDPRERPGPARLRLPARGRRRVPPSGTRPSGRPRSARGLAAPRPRFVTRQRRGRKTGTGSRRRLKGRSRQRPGGPGACPRFPVVKQTLTRNDRRRCDFLPEWRKLEHHERSGIRRSGEPCSLHLLSGELSDRGGLDREP